MTPATNANKKLLVPSIIVLVLLVAVFVGYAYFTKSDDVTATNQTPVDTAKSQTPTTTDSTSQPPVATTPVASRYKNGTYTATGTYRTPENEEQITVTVTLVNDKVADVSATISATNPDSRRYQTLFLANYKQLVVGKSIDSLHLSQVSGSSLTSAGFNDAISQIKTQAVS